jgi:AhpD family alkylhydroperoxidase
MSERRLDHRATAPDGMRALDRVHGYVAASGLAKTLIDLVYLRVSLINGCAYCIDLHTRDLRDAGVAVEKIVLVPVWEEAGEVFSAEERAALRWAETVTRIAETTAPDPEYYAAAAVFTEKQLADLTIAIALMNAYNRLGVAFRSLPKAAATAASAQRDGLRGEAAQ